MATWTTYAGHDLTVPGAGAFGGDGLPGQTPSDISKSSSTVQFYTMPDGTFTVLHGTGFVQSSFGASWTSLTSVDHIAANGTTLIEQITGIDPTIKNEAGHF